MIDLPIENEINFKNETKEEIGGFVKELQNSLNKEVYITTLNMEILNEIALATKYKDKLNNIVTKCMEELSYENEFLYFDYDKKEKSYYFDLYSYGEVSREYLLNDDVKGMEFQIGTIWEIGSEDIILADDLKDNIKINADYELFVLDIESQKGSR